MSGVVLARLPKKANLPLKVFVFGLGVRACVLRSDLTGLAVAGRGAGVASLPTRRVGASELPGRGDTAVLRVADGPALSSYPSLSATSEADDRLL
ncbi:hypothetical protein HYQ46_008398 [Verticillium longisporum]|nr:hypothetical protein HYQ46_008398 [Verticillium longisporum]